MGCDIHILFEGKDRSGHWRNIDYWQYNEYYTEDPEEEEEYNLVEVYAGRSYSLFTELAKVRNNNELSPTMGDPKGVPNDVNQRTKKHIDSWSGDGHSHSFHTLKELKDFCLTYPDNQVQYLVAPIEDRLKECLWNYETKDDNDYRIVFFFDN